MRSLESRPSTYPVAVEMLTGVNDETLFEAFQNGKVPRGTRLEITTEKVQPDEDGNGARVILLFSTRYPYAKAYGYEHMVFSDDGKIDSMTQRNLTSWKVLDIVPEAEIERRSSEMALDKHGS